MAIETEKLEASADSRIPSQEETDHLKRSTKKIKTTEKPPQEGTTGGDKSFKETLLGYKSKDGSWIDTMMVEGEDVDSDDESETLSKDGIPTVKITKEMKKLLRAPWRSDY